VIKDITIPLIFKIYKPKTRLKDIETTENQTQNIKEKEKEKYLTKPEIAIELIEEIVKEGFNIKLVLTDSLYGESGDFVRKLQELKLKYVLAIRSNHAVIVMPGEKLRYTTWSKYERVFSNNEKEVRYIREIIYGRRRKTRFYQVTTDKELLPKESTYFFMTNLEGKIKKEVGNLYGLRTWVEYGLKQSKSELGWSDYRFTDYFNIERWWELCFTAYLMVSLQSPVFSCPSPSPNPSPNPSPSSNLKIKNSNSQNSLSKNGSLLNIKFSSHIWWDKSKGWKNLLNNLRLIIQPYIFFSSQPLDSDF